MLFNFASEYAIIRVLTNQQSLKLNIMHQLLVYVDDVNTLGGRMCTIKKNTESLVVPSEETGLEVNAQNKRYMVMS